MKNTPTHINVAEHEWYKAITLDERVASLQTSHISMCLENVDTGLAERRLERWRSETPFAEDGSRLVERLAADGIREEELRYLLGEHSKNLRDRFVEQPTWLEELSQAFSEYSDTRSSLKNWEGHFSRDASGLLQVIEPLIARARKRLYEGIKSISRDRETPYDCVRLEELLFADLPKQLLRKLSRTMVLELHVARVEELLEGENPEERFKSFVQRLSRTDIALEILREYPVLARQLVVCVDQWVETSLEFAGHLCDDWEDIKGRFCPTFSPGELVDLEGGAGDRHRGGRSVYILTFNSGFRLVYKPRSLAVDVHFQELLTWLNARGDHPPFRVLEILDENDHGWVEYVEDYGCSSNREIEDFYRRQGGYLALLYALHATDFHHGNLIASGEHPVLVDLEALFHQGSPQDADVQNTLLANNVLRRSVCGIGLLPRLSWADEEKEGVDISGLGGGEGQMSPNLIPYWENYATDEMYLSRERMEMQGASNRPTLKGSEVETLDFADELISGFTEVYRLLVCHRNELVTKGGPLERFAGDEVRYVARPTRAYAALLLESFHPDLLREALDRDRFFDNLWISEVEDSDLARLLKHERKDLQRGDIPMFTTHPDSCDLWSTSNERVPNFFDEPSLSQARRRVLELGEEDLNRQIWFIRESFTALTLSENYMQWPSYSLPEPGRKAMPAELSAASRMIGDRLGVLALRGKYDASWFGLTAINERDHVLAPLDAGLYSGLSGITLFLGYLGDVIREEKYTDLAERAVQTIRKQWEHIQSSGDTRLFEQLPLKIGGFNQLGGTVYTLTHLGMLWNKLELLKEAEELVEFASSLIERDEKFDIMGGAAGYICVLLSLYKHRSSKRTLELATQCGDHLVANAQYMEQGVGWREPLHTKPLTGFSHGASGIAYALLKLGSVSGERRFQDTALQAIAYERSVFSYEKDNWPDFRDMENFGRPAPPDGGEHFMMAWCHGAPGIGLSRLQALSYVDNPEARKEIRNETETALRTTLSAGFGTNHSLCHGALGNLELLLKAGKLLDNPELVSETYQIAAGVLQSIEEHGWLCGIPLGVETPDLMCGLSGVGYELLRLAAPDRVPSVLCLESPICSCG